MSYTTPQVSNTCALRKLHNKQEAVTFDKNSAVQMGKNRRGPVISNPTVEYSTCNMKQFSFLKWL